MRGRVGFYEIFLTNMAIRQATTRRATSLELGRLVGPEFQTMRRDGVVKAAQGLTLLNEVFSATQDAEEVPEE